MSNEEGDDFLGKRAEAKVLVPRVMTVSSLCSSHAAMANAHPQAYRQRNAIGSKQHGGLEQGLHALNSGVFKWACCWQSSDSYGFRQHN